MAYRFDGSLSQYLRGSAPATTWPLTLCCWFRADSDAADQTLFFLGDESGTNHYWTLEASGAIAGDPVRILARAGAGTNDVATTTGYTAGRWHHACGTIISATSRRVLIDAGSAAMAATSRIPLGVNALYLGYRASSAAFTPLFGQVAHPALWRVILSDDEISRLARGESPRRVRPSELIFYRDLRRGLRRPYLGVPDLAPSASAPQPAAVTDARVDRPEPTGIWLVAAAGFPAGGGAGTATPPVVLATGTVPAPTPTGAALVPIGLTVPAFGTLPTAMATGGVAGTATPDTVLSMGTVPAPGATGAAAAPPAWLVATGTLPAAVAIAGGAGTATPDVLIATGSVPVSGATGAALSGLAVLVASGTLPAVTASAAGTGTATPDVLVATGTVPAPTATGAAVALVSVLVATGTVPDVSAIEGVIGPLPYTLFTLPVPTDAGGGFAFDTTLTRPVAD